MSITINGYDVPPCIMLDGEHFKLNFDMGSKCDSPDQEDDDLTLAFGKPHEIDLEELRHEVLGKFHDNLKKFDIIASCKWDGRGLHLYITMSQFGVQKLRFDFVIPYESAIVVLQDKRRKTA